MKDLDYDNYDNPWCDECPNAQRHGLAEECAPCMAIIRLQRSIERTIVAVEGVIESSGPLPY